jgi:hypothetical protein
MPDFRSRHRPTSLPRQGPICNEADRLAAFQRLSALATSQTCTQGAKHGEFPSLSFFLNRTSQRLPTAATLVPVTFQRPVE